MGMIMKHLGWVRHSVGTNTCSSTESSSDNQSFCHSFSGKTRAHLTRPFIVLIYPSWRECSYCSQNMNSVGLLGPSADCTGAVCKRNNHMPYFIFQNKIPKFLTNLSTLRASGGGLWVLSDDVNNGYTEMTL